MYLPSQVIKKLFTNNTPPYSIQRNERLLGGKWKATSEMNDSEISTGLQ